MRVNTAILVLLMIWFAGLAHAERLAVSANIANVRSGPGTKYDVIWQIEKYHPIFVIHKADPWYQFKDFEDDKGWVHKSLVGRIKTVITKGETCNIRSGPGTKHNVLLTVPKGIPFKVKARKNQWMHIQHADGDQGWIHASLVW